MNWLSTVPLLQKLAKSERSRIAQELEPMDFAAGKPIITQGDKGDAMFFLERGSAQAEVGGKVVMAYSPGDFFGELALLDDSARAATVRAGAELGCRVLRLGRTLFEEVLNDAFSTFTYKM